MLSEIAQDVKQLQNLASASKSESSPEQSSAAEFSGNYFPGFSPDQPRPGFIPQTATPQHPDPRPQIGVQGFTDPAIPPTRQSTAPAPGYPSRRQYSQGQTDLPREHQRRRLHPPTANQPFTPSSQDADADEESQDSEIVHMAGQLSLDENKTVRYHGSSSGLTLLTRSKRFDGTFWNLPNPGFWPASDRRTVKTELEIDSKTQLPPIATQDRLLEYIPSIIYLTIDYIGNISIHMSHYSTKIISLNNWLGIDRVVYLPLLKRI